MLGQLVLVAWSVRLSTLVVFIQLSVKIASEIISSNHALGEGQTSFFETDVCFSCIQTRQNVLGACSEGVRGVLELIRM